MKFGLQYFSGQLIYLIILVFMSFGGVVFSFHYSNQQILHSYELIMNEEAEKNILNQLSAEISLARQAEKGFYLNPDQQNELKVISHLDNTRKIFNELYRIEINKKTVNNNIKDYLTVEQLIIQYEQLFHQIVKKWHQRGYQREAGLGLKLQTIAYTGLRNKLSSFKTYNLKALLYQLRWLEYEYFSYGKKYIPQIKNLLVTFINAVESSALIDTLALQLLEILTKYQQHIIDIENTKTGNVNNSVLESYSKQLTTLIESHSIKDFAYLFRTLVYYEMEYRELGQQKKHIEGVYHTLNELSANVAESMVKESAKKQIIDDILEYKEAFKQLVTIDRSIESLQTKITATVNKLYPAIKERIQHEMESMQKLGEFSSRNNAYITRVNFIIVIILLSFSIFIVFIMIRKLAAKVSRIGYALNLINQGNYSEHLTVPAEGKRSELDTIGLHINELTNNLKNSISELTKRNLQLEHVSNKLSKYLSPQIYSSIFTGHQSVAIESKRKKLTVFFSDIVNFTQTTEDMESEELTWLLNEYLNEMSQIALKYGGTIDKYIGDAIMIFFGDPQSRGEKQDALSCVLMAMEMQNRMTQLQHHWENEKGISTPFKIRIGIASGYCTVGNFGSNERMDYTIIGNAVNLASRLEHHASISEILLSKETYNLIKDNIQCIKSDKIQVKGFSQPLQTYQVDLSNKPDSINEIHENGPGYRLEIEPKDLNKQQRFELSEKLKELAGKITSY